MSQFKITVQEWNWAATIGKFETFISIRWFNLFVFLDDVWFHCDWFSQLPQIDDEVDKHMELLKEIQENPLDINAIVAQRRNEFTGDFFHHLNILQESLDSLEDRDGN